MKDQIVVLAKELIAIPSTKENPKELKNVLLRAEKELHGFTVEWFEKDGIPSILAYKEKKRPNRFKVILNAHLDVVPALEKQYKPFEKDGKLYGRGSDDMKAASAVEVLVFKELARTLPFPIGLQLVTDEEVGGFKGTKHQVDGGVRADFVIAGEPTDFGVNNKAKGILWMKITTKGSSAHGAYPWQGVNAIQKANGVINAIYKRFPIPEKETWRTTVNIARIETPNKTFNKVPDECTISLDIRFVPEDEKIILDELKKLVPSNAQVEVLEQEPPQFSDKNSHHIKRLRKATEEVLKKKSKIIVKHGGSDIRLFNAVGCEGVTFGPIGAGLHTDREWVEIQSLEDYYHILKEFLLSLHE